MAAQVALRRQQEQEEELGISVPDVITTEQQQQLIQQHQGSNPTPTSAASPLTLLGQSQAAPSGSQASQGRLSMAHSPDILLYDEPPCKWRIFLFFTARCHWHKNVHLICNKIGAKKYPWISRSTNQLA